MSCFRRVAVATTICLLVSTPALSQASKTHLGDKPSTMVNLEQKNVLSLQRECFEALNDSGESIGDFTIPEGSVFVLTDAIIQGASGLIRGSIGQCDDLFPGLIRAGFRFEASQQQTLHIPFTSGIVFRNPPSVFNGGNLTLTVQLFGYLAKDK